MFYLGAVGALIAGAIQASQPLFFLIIPYLSFGMSLVMVHHNAVIGAIIEYCTHELGENLNERGVTFSQWDNSIARRLSSKSTKHYRLWGDLGLILGPSLFAVGYNWELLFEHDEKLIALLFAIAFSVVSAIFLLKTLSIRNKVFRKIDSRPNTIEL